MTIYGTPHLEYLFNIYNKDYFNGELPVPLFGIINDLKYFGYFSSSVYCCDGKSRPLIQINDSWDYTEKQIRDIMVHEMIHYYLWYKGQDIEVTHGMMFHLTANRLNRTYGLNITEIINYHEYKLKRGVSKIRLWLTRIFG